MSEYVILYDETPTYGLGTAAMVGAQNAQPMNATIKTENLKPNEVEELRKEPRVLGMARDFVTSLVKPMVLTGEPAASNSSWGVQAVGAHTSKYTGLGVSVAILDTGIDAKHDAFSDAALNLTQMDFTGDGDGDENGHGTHVAGTVFGREVGGMKIGVASGVTDAYIAKILDKYGRGSSQMMFAGIKWALDQNANIISMSLGFDFPGMVAKMVEEDIPVEAATSQTLVAYRDNLRMVDALTLQARRMSPFGTDTIFFAASGNESNRPQYEVATAIPAAGDGVMSIGAAFINADGKYEIADFSNFSVTVSAPGVDVVSAKTGGGLISMNGTSMACPHAAGVAALHWEKSLSKGKFANAEFVKAQMISTANPDVFETTTPFSQTGEGLVAAPV